MVEVPSEPWVHLEEDQARIQLVISPLHQVESLVRPSK